MLRVDLRLADSLGEIALEVRGLSLRPVRDPGSFALTAPDDESPAARNVAPLLALAEDLGIRRAEGALLLERLLATGKARLIASSVDLDSLRESRDGAGDTGDSANAADTPAISVAELLTTMWRDLLGVADIAPTDDFFDLGGHSLIAIRLMARIHRELGVRFQLATLFEAPTIEKLAALVRAERPDIDATLARAASPDAPAVTAADAPTPNRTSSLVPIRSAGTKEPFFIVHGAGGNVLYLWSLARALPEGRPVYGFQANGIDGHDQPDPTIESMAARYVAELRAFKPGPYLLGGYSGGGVIALEMVTQLEALGERVQYLVLFDSIDPQYLDPPFDSRLKNVTRNLAREGLRELWPFIDELARKRYRRIVPTPPGKRAARERQSREMGYQDVTELGFVDLEDHFAEIVHNYRFGRYVTDCALLKADEVWPVFPPDYYWRNYVTGHIDIVSVPGNHHTMFAPDNAPILAAKLSRLLDEHEPA